MYKIFFYCTNVQTQNFDQGSKYYQKQKNILIAYCLSLCLGILTWYDTLNMIICWNDSDNIQKEISNV